jgi:hypothetical protein
VAPYYDALPGPVVVPAYHDVSGLTRAAGAKIVAATSSDEARVRCLAYRSERATLLWVANLTAQEQSVRVEHDGADPYGIVLDEGSFERAVTDPVGFQTDVAAIDGRGLRLGAYAVALVCIGDA